MVTVTYYGGIYPVDYSSFFDIVNYDNIRHMDCEDINIFTLPKLPNRLQTLNCSQNDLTSLPDLPDTLEFLDCSQNDLAYLPDLPDTLKALDCSFNNISSLPKLPLNLEELYINDNSIKEINLEDNLDLLTIDCSENDLVSLGSKLPNSLEKLLCCSNRLTTLPDLPNSLEELVCSINRLTALPNLPINLKYLSCFNNQLTSIPSNIVNLRLLEHIDIVDNPIETIPAEVEMFINRIMHRKKQGVKVYSDVQNVHDSSINKSIKTSISNIMKEEVDMYMDI